MSCFRGWCNFHHRKPSFPSKVSQRAFAARLGTFRRAEYIRCSVVRNAPGQRTRPGGDGAGKGKRLHQSQKQSLAEPGLKNNTVPGNLSAVSCI